MNIQIQPLSKWSDRKTSSRQASNFSATWSQTIQLLEKELQLLRASNSILHTMHSPDDIRLDGKLRTDTRKPAEPGVVLTFSIPCPPEESQCEHCRKGLWRSYDKKEHGQDKLPCTDPQPAPIKMRYVTDHFTDWKDNVRAIALGLEAQRKMDRYGLNKGGQYAGFRALPPANVKSELTPEMAAFVIAEYFAKSVGLSDVTSEPMLASLEYAEMCYKTAAKKFHPDKGGSQHDFEQLERAISTLRAQDNGKN